MLSWPLVSYKKSHSTTKTNQRRLNLTGMYSCWVITILPFKNNILRIMKRRLKTIKNQKRLLRIQEKETWVYWFPVIKLYADFSLSSKIWELKWLKRWRKGKRMIRKDMFSIFFSIKKTTVLARKMTFSIKRKSSIISKKSHITMSLPDKLLAIASEHEKSPTKPQKEMRDLCLTTELILWVLLITQQIVMVWIKRERWE